MRWRWAGVGVRVPEVKVVFWVGVSVRALLTLGAEEGLEVGVLEAR